MPWYIPSRRQSSATLFHAAETVKNDPIILLRTVLFTGLTFDVFDYTFAVTCFTGSLLSLREI